MAGEPYTPELDHLISEHRHSGKQFAEIGSIIGRSADSVRSRWKSIKDSPPTLAPQTIEKFKESFQDQRIKALEIELANVTIGNTGRSFHVDPDYKETRDIKKFWELSERDSIDRITKATLMGKAKISLPNEVFAVAYVSDQHLGPGTPCDMKRMREDAELIANTPGLYAFCMGDGVDNHIKHRSAMLNSRSQPGEQYELYEYYLGIFADSILALISGNHDDWTKQFAGVDVVYRIAKNHRMFYAPDEARLRINVGNQEYKFAGRHQYKMASSFKQGHSVKQWLRLGEEEFDVGGVGHHHEAHIECHLYRGKRTWIVRPGSYQITSQYSRQFGFNDSVPSCPTIVCWPDKRHTVGFHDVRDAVEYLAWARAKSI